MPRPTPRPRYALTATPLPHATPRHATPHRLHREVPASVRRQVGVGEDKGKTFDCGLRRKAGLGLASSGNCRGLWNVGAVAVWQLGQPGSGPEGESLIEKGVEGVSSGLVGLQVNDTLAR